MIIETFLIVKYHIYQVNLSVFLQEISYLSKQLYVGRRC